MSESFLHYVWQFQYFSRQDLQTTDGEVIQVFNPGMLNGHAGPDFSQARIQIGDIEWVGNVEIHINSSDWKQHHHDEDGAYDNVILHVVWKNDKPVVHRDGTTLPTLELKSRVAESLLLQYRKLINSPEAIPCARTYPDVDDILKVSMLDKALVHRLQSKAETVCQILDKNNHDWEETTYQLLSRNFGFKVNAEPLDQLSKSLPFKVLLKHADKLIQVEAMLFGQAGFLDDECDDEYYNVLKREYRLLSQKYSLTDGKLDKIQWRFLRLRPANFPTIRLAQLSVLIHQQHHIFSRILEAPTYDKLKALFTVQQSSYWLHHYQFSKQTKGNIAGLGAMSIDNIIINTVAPLLAAYSKMKDEQMWLDRACDILQHVPAENNAIIRQWLALKQPVQSAFDTQALIEMFNQFCAKRKCLDCVVGNHLLKPLTV